LLLSHFDAEARAYRIYGRRAYSIYGRMGYAVSKVLGSSGNGMTGSVAEMVYAATDASSSTLVVTESFCE
jgi:hypothetical protein